MTDASHGVFIVGDMLF